MSTSWLSPSFYSWLADHGELVPFIEIESFPANLKSQEKEEKIENYKKNREKSIEELLNFSTEQLVITEPEICESSRPGLDSAKKAVFLFHVICFIQHEIYNEQLKTFNKSLAMCSSIISLLQSDDIQNTFNIKIDFSGLYKLLLVESKETLCLRFKYQSYANEYSKNISAKANKSLLIEILHRTLDMCANQMSKGSSYFYPNNADQRILQILMCSSSPVKSEFEELITKFSEKPRKEFTQSILAFFEHVASIFDVTDPQEQSALFILLIRVSFSNAYANDPSYFYPKEITRKAVDPRKILCKTICNEREVLRENELIMPVYDVFGKGDFEKATKYINFAALHINPIDALFEINEAISLTQRVVSFRLGFENASILPFEQLFGPMVGVILSSGVEEIFSLGSYIIDFAPQTGLSSELEFAFVTAEALFKYISSLKEDDALTN